MKQKTIIIVGGGYAGIHLLKGLRKQLKKWIGKEIRLILIDKNPYHLRKVLLFKTIASNMDLRIPYTKYCGDDAKFIQGEVLSVQNRDNTLTLIKDGQCEYLSYDYLIISLGSIVKQVSTDLGGIALADMESAQAIRHQIMEGINHLHNDSDDKKRLKISIVGGGITGIETAADLASWLKEEDNTIQVEMTLINSQSRLLPHIPENVSYKVENQLNQLGIRVLHGKKADQFKDRQIQFMDQSTLSSDICIWTTGLIPNPVIRKLGLLTDATGRLKVNSFYKVENTNNVYALGDAAFISDPKTGQIAGMTCKEGIAQAGRLSKSIKREIQNKRPLSHKHHMDLYCIGLGRNRGLVWMKKWGVQLILSGKFGRKIRQLTWDQASMISK